MSDLYMLHNPVYEVQIWFRLFQLQNTHIYMHNYYTMYNNNNYQYTLGMITKYGYGSFAFNLNINKCQKGAISYTVETCGWVEWGKYWLLVSTSNCGRDKVMSCVLDIVHIMFHLYGLAGFRHGIERLGYTGLTRTFIFWSPSYLQFSFSLPN